MESLTISIAVIMSILVFCFKPVWSLIFYFAVLAWYPSYLTVKIGTIDFTVCRIVILAIYINLLLRTNLPKQLRFIWLDKIILVYFIAQILAGVTTVPMMALFENRAGAIFDKVLPYFAVRMIITKKEQYIYLLKGILCVAAPVALIGFYQSLTGHNPVAFFQQYHAWNVVSGSLVSRFGFHRAHVAFSHPIMFGLFFAVLGPICLGLLHNINAKKFIYVVGIGLMGIGVFSSMSSGPLLCTIFAIAFIALYPYRRNWKIVTVTVLLICGLLDIASNRQFYDLVDYFTFSKSTAWYRGRLMEVALFEGGMSGHWLAGYGFADPGWGAKINGIEVTDMVNHYLVVLCRYGLIGFIPFIVTITCVVKRLRKAFRESTLPEDRWLIWCLSGSLFGLLSAFYSVSLFGQTDTIFYLMIGLCAVMPIIVRDSNSLSYYMTGNLDPKLPYDGFMKSHPLNGLSVPESTYR